MAGAIRIHETGGAEVLRYEDVDVGEPGPGQIKLKQTAIGLNYIDVYFRTGLYPAPSLPFTPGLEAAGVVEAVGEGVDDLAVGDRVAYAAPPIGAYAGERLMPADKVVPVPDGVSDEQAAAMMLKGMTAWYLLRRTFPVAKGQTILFHAAAGGVGLIACQWAKHLGVEVIGTVGSEAKAALASAHGCAHVIRYDQENVVERVKEITSGQKVSVVYDSVGADTFEASLDCLAPLGMLVCFGQSSGPVPPFDLGVLNTKGSLFLTRPSLMAYTAAREDLLTAARDLFAVVESGAVKIEINQRFPLEEASAAHQALEGRKTTGSTLLMP
ncbi:MAG: quinone oxidoreductase [Alphaproteobacteria bacterium]|nr:quinone oxidoreductase [Alphaproteobacteria bacterium]